jgi:hypothetical protein
MGLFDEKSCLGGTVNDRVGGDLARIAQEISFVR